MDREESHSRFSVEAKQDAIEVIDRLPEVQLPALAGLLESTVDPVTVALSNAPPSLRG